MDADTMRKMVGWLGPDAPAITYHEETWLADDETVPAGFFLSDGTRLPLWLVADSIERRVAERLEREGTTIYKQRGEWWCYDALDMHGPFPTKSAAVIAAWKHETGASP